MRFQLDDYNLQFVASQFSANELIETVMETKLLRIPIKHDIAMQALGRNITTTLLMAIIPQLFRTYGGKPIDMVILPLSGTEIKWSVESQAHELHYKAAFDIFIVQNNGTVEKAFSSIIDGNAKLGLQIGENKSVNFTLANLQLTSFNVTEDHCNV
jgi:hypothetical protein